MKRAWVVLALWLLSVQVLSQESLDALDARLAELGRAQKWTEALPLAIQMVEVARLSKGPESAEMATCLNNLGAVQSQVGQSAQAVDNLRAAVRIREKVLGPDALLTATALYSLGNVYQSMSEYSKAEDALLRCLSIRESRLGATHPDTQATLHHLAVVAHARGDLARENEYAARAGAHLPPEVVLATGQATDPMQQRMAIDEYQLARGLEDRKDYPGAADHYRRCLDYALVAYPGGDLTHADFGGRPLAQIARRCLELNLTLVRANWSTRVFQVHRLYRQLEMLEPQNPCWTYLDAAIWARAGNLREANRLLDRIQAQGSPRFQAKTAALRAQLALAEEARDPKAYYESGSWIPNGPGGVEADQPDWERRARLAQNQLDLPASIRLRTGLSTCADLDKYR